MEILFHSLHNQHTEWKNFTYYCSLSYIWPNQQRLREPWGDLVLRVSKMMKKERRGGGGRQPRSTRFIPDHFRSWDTFSHIFTMLKFLWNPPFSKRGHPIPLGLWWRWYWRPYWDNFPTRLSGMYLKLKQHLYGCLTSLSRVETIVQILSCVSISGEPRHRNILALSDL